MPCFKFLTEVALNSGTFLGIPVNLPNIKVMIGC